MVKMDNPYSYLSLYGQLCCGTQEPVAVEQVEASIGIVEVATASVMKLNKIQGEKSYNKSRNMPRQHSRLRRLKITMSP